MVTMQGLDWAPWSQGGRDLCLCVLGPRDRIALTPDLGQQRGGPHGRARLWSREPSSCFTTCTEMNLCFSGASLKP